LAALPNIICSGKRIASGLENRGRLGGKHVGGSSPLKGTPGLEKPEDVRPTILFTREQR
jgi:hypothetical protein